jgi:hypothetical protein
MSWIKIRQALLDLSRAHDQVNSFGTFNGIQPSIDTASIVRFDTLSQDRIQYPLVIADLESAQAISSRLVVTVGVYFLDRVENVRQIGSVVSGLTGWRNNEDEVVSDMLDVAQDYIAYFTDEPSYDFTLQESTSLQRFSEAFDDKTSGWKATLVFDVPYSRDVCSIPT